MGGDERFVIIGLAHFSLRIRPEAERGGSAFDLWRPEGVFACEDFVRFEDGEEPADGIAPVFEAAVDARAGRR